MIAASPRSATPEQRSLHARRVALSSRVSFILLEVIASLALTGILLGVITGLVLTYNRAGDYYMSHHQAQLAAESYVEHLRAGSAVPAGTDRVRFEVRGCPGEGDWSGLTQVTVTASVKTRYGRTPRAANYTLTTYVLEAVP